MDLIIPLDFNVNSYGDYWGRSSVIADPIILERLQNAGQEGWQADGPVDLLSLSRANRLDAKSTAMGFSFHVGTARIRMKRLV